MEANIFGRRPLLAAAASVPFVGAKPYAKEDLGSGLLTGDLIFPPIDPFKPYGYSEPSRREKSEAAAVLRLAPTGPTPFAIARWFARKANKHYIEQWPASDHWNPVIVEFFRKGTGYHASNDMIAWCSAFVNYCIVQTGNRGTLNPSSQSFLPNYTPKKPGTGIFRATTNPRVGDIVVFTCYRLDNGYSVGLGHVGFLNGDPTAKMIPLLAGNQSAAGSYSIISEVNFPVEQNTHRNLGNGVKLPVKLKLNSILRET